MRRRAGVGLVVLLAVLVVLGWVVFGRRAATADPTALLPAAGTSGVVLLIPGYGGDGAALEQLAGVLAGEGWTTRAVDIADGTGDIGGYGRLVAEQARTAAEYGGPVALVGYSEGGLIARAAISSGAAPYVSRVVTIGSPHAGTSIAGLGEFLDSAECDTACRQMAPESEFLSGLPVAGDPSRWLALYSEDDDVVLPADSGALAGATTVRLQDACPGRVADHGQLVVDSYVVAAVPQFLSTGTIPTACR